MPHYKRKRKTQDRSVKADRSEGCNNDDLITRNIKIKTTHKKCLPFLTNLKPRKSPVILSLSLRKTWTEKTHNYRNVIAFINKQTKQLEKQNKKIDPKPKLSQQLILLI